MTITNATFVIERVLNASPARVFAAYSSLEAKSAWFKAPADIETLNRDFDFRVGGKERFHARWPSGMVTDFQAIYHDIVENERIGTRHERARDQDAPPLASRHLVQRLLRQVRRLHSRERVLRTCLHRIRELVV